MSDASKETVKAEAVVSATATASTSPAFSRLGDLLEWIASLPIEQQKHATLTMLGGIVARLRSLGVPPEETAALIISVFPR